MDAGGDGGRRQPDWVARSDMMRTLGSTASSARRCVHSRRSSSTSPSTTGRRRSPGMLADIGEVEACRRRRDAGPHPLPGRGLRGDVEAASRWPRRCSSSSRSASSVALEAGMRRPMPTSTSASTTWTAATTSSGAVPQRRRARPPVRRLPGTGRLVAAAVRTGRADEMTPLMAEASRRLGTPGHPAPARAGQGSGPARRRRGRGVPCRRDRRRPGRQWPFELANARLEYGVWLRRRHRATDARA